MQVALDKYGYRICADKASKESQYFCPICGNSLILRQGDLNISHFAHKTNTCTDSWNYDMSEWHYNIQNRFHPEQREVVVKHMGQTHRADVLNGNQVLEFQHSPISMEEIIERNTFYNSAGYNVAWIFDVQAQYDSGAIYPVEHDNALMYGWNNPKRCLQCFPLPKEHSRSAIIYLYWIDEDSIECFNRIIWSAPNETRQPSFKRFITSEHYIDTTSEHLNVNDFFETNDDLLAQRLKSLNCSYQKKYIGVRGYRQNAYICPRTNVFGLTLSGEQACSYCRYCAAIKKIYNKKHEIYCCFPNQVNEITDTVSGYECSNIPRF